MITDDTNNPNDLRLIQTARTEVSINKAVKAGFRPLVKQVKPSKKIRSKFCVWQNLITGEIEVVGDYRGGHFGESWQEVIGWSEYYPHHFPRPFAAYLIPRDIQVGERVWVEDLIEDFIGTRWNQGDNYRLDSCEAVWDGTDLKIQFSESRNRQVIIG